jgi:type IV secretion system protein VirB3
MTARFPLFKGATRVPTVAGVPLVPLVSLVVSVTSVAVMFGIWWLALLVPGWLLMAQVTRSDDRAFRILWLWMRTKLANRLRMIRFSGRDEFWGASTYSPSDGRRSWEREGGRCGR